MRCSRRIRRAAGTGSRITLISILIDAKHCVDGALSADPPHPEHIDKTPPERGFSFRQSGLYGAAYVQVNASVIRSLDGRKIAAALGTAGRPSEMSGGKKVNTYLDAESIAIATRIGNGNVSEGIRKALKQADR